MVNQWLGYQLIHPIYYQGDYELELRINEEDGEELGCLHVKFSMKKRSKGWLFKIWRQKELDRQSLGNKTEVYADDHKNDRDFKTRHLRRKDKEKNKRKRRGHKRKKEEDFLLSRKSKREDGQKYTQGRVSENIYEKEEAEEEVNDTKTRKRRNQKKRKKRLKERENEIKGKIKTIIFTSTPSWKTLTQKILVVRKLFPNTKATEDNRICKPEMCWELELRASAVTVDKSLLAFQH